MKVCKRCGEQKDLSEFYKHKKMGDGYLSFCKDCTKARVKNHRSKNIERIREYDRIRGRTESRKQKCRDYNKTERGRLAVKKSCKRWAEKNKHKIKAQSAVHRAVVRGDLKRPPACSQCECVSENIQAHHSDYTKPLDVTWLCVDCHGLIHRKY